MALTNINGNYLDFIESNSDARTYVFYGGAGSGKSVFVMQYLIKTALERKVNILVLRKWREVVRESVIEPFKEIAIEFGIDWENKYHKTERTVSIEKSRVVFGGLDNVEKYKGTNWNFIWIEEATDITQADFNLLNLRLGRNTENAKFIITFNPIDINHWLIQRFILNTPENTALNKSTYLDNYEFLSQSFIDELENLIEVDENFYRVYTLGEPGILKNIIYSNYIIEDFEIQPEIYAEDYGFNNPTAMLAIQMKDNELYVKEMLYQKGMTTDDLIGWKEKENIPKNKLTYGDSAEPKTMETQRRAGYNVKPSDKNVKAGIDFLKSKRIHVHKDSYNLQQEIKSYKYKELKDGTVLDEPVKYFDHLMDAMRYGAFTHYHNKRKDTKSILGSIPISFGGIR